jgi:hypothetical protein
MMPMAARSGADMCPAYFDAAGMPLALLQSRGLAPHQLRRPVFGLSQSSVTTDIASASFSSSRSSSQCCRDADGVQAEADSGFL